MNKDLAPLIWTTKFAARYLPNVHRDTSGAVRIDIRI